MKDSKIEWTDHTFNPWWGCAKVSPGCAHCYAETFAKRTGNAVWGGDAPRRFFGDKHWNERGAMRRGGEIERNSMKEKPVNEAANSRTAKAQPRRASAIGSAHVWIVEMLGDDDRWHPTVGCRLSKTDGREELKDWKHRNPSDHFRLARYAPNAAGEQTRKENHE